VARVNFHRLRILARHLERLHRTPPDQRQRRFNMATWFTRPSISDDPDRTHCGTAACAAGEACTIKEFNEAGLRLNWASEHSTHAAPVFRTHRGDTALKWFFGIPFDKVQWFFMPEQYPGHLYQRCAITPGTVARRIRKFIREAA
jgi:hypothetical protein